MDITCPNCKYSRNVPDDKVPATSVKATCPQCGTKFKFRDIDLSAMGDEEPKPAAPGDPASKPEPVAAAETPEPATEASPETPADEAPKPTPEPVAEPAPEPQEPPGPEPAARPQGQGDIWQNLDELGDKHPGREDGPRRPGPGFTPPDDGTMEVPFERLDHFGFFGGLFETCKRAIMAPRLFFETMPVNRGYGRPTAFYVLLNMIIILLQLAVLFAMGGIQAPSGADLPPGVEELTAGGMLGMLYLSAFIVGPMFITIWLFVCSGILHIMLTLLQGVSGGFQGTVRAVSYACPALLVTIVPHYIPVLLGLAWYLVILVHGIRGVHKTTYLKAALSVVFYFMPFLVLLSSSAQQMGPGF